MEEVDIVIDVIAQCEIASVEIKWKSGENGDTYRRRANGRLSERQQK